MLYVAYGSNLNMAQMMHRCPGAKVFGTATIKDYRLLFRRGVLTIEPAKGYEVPVGIWNVTESDIVNLDRYEGYPTMYYKRNLMLDCSDGKRHRVFVYIMHSDFRLGGPGTGYMQTCLQGYDDFGFNPNCLYEAAEYSWEGGVA